MDPVKDKCSEICDDVTCECSGRCLGEGIAKGLEGLWIAIKGVGSCLHAFSTGLAGLIWSIIALAIIVLLIYGWYVYGDSVDFVRNSFDKAKSSINSFG